MSEENKVNTEEEGTSQSPMETSQEQVEISEVDQFKQKITELENNLSQYKDQLLRKAAEFENYKKRVGNDYSSIVKFSNEELIESLLPVIDDFERSMKMRKNTDDQVDTDNETTFMKGVDLIHNKLMKILESRGLKHFEVVGVPFDPQYHDALLQVYKDDLPPHTVIEEIDKGYMLHDKVIRHAKVIVSSDSQHVEEPIKNIETESSSDSPGEINT